MWLQEVPRKLFVTKEKNSGFWRNSYLAQPTPSDSSKKVITEWQENKIQILLYDIDRILGGLPALNVCLFCTSKKFEVLLIYNHHTLVLQFFIFSSQGVSSLKKVMGSFSKRFFEPLWILHWRIPSGWIGIFSEISRWTMI